MLANVYTSGPTFHLWSRWTPEDQMSSVPRFLSALWGDPIYHVLNVPMHPEMCTLTTGIATFDPGKGWVVTSFYIIQETGKIPLEATSEATSEAPCWVCGCLGGWTQDQQASTPAHLSLKYLDWGRKDTHIRGIWKHRTEKPPGPMGIRTQNLLVRRLSLYCYTTNNNV